MQQMESVSDQKIKHNPGPIYNVNFCFTSYTSVTNYYTSFPKYVVVSSASRLGVTSRRRLFCYTTDELKLFLFELEK